MRFAGWCSAVIGTLMLVQWVLFIAAGQVPELQSEPIRIALHLAAEGATALALIAAGALSARGRAGAAVLGLVANGMLAYTAIVSPGYFAQRGEWSLVGMFGIILVLALVNIALFALTIAHREPAVPTSTSTEEPMVENPGRRYLVAHIDEIDSLPEKDRTREWKPIRHHFAVGSFGVNLYRSTAAGELLVHLHDETDTGHEELFFVAQGDARFSVDGEEFDTPAGTFVHVVEPSAIRGVRAQEAGCVLLVIGGKPGTAYRVQDWELEEFGPEG